MDNTRPTVSVVVEWYNTTYAELDRAFRMLRSLTEQAASLPQFASPLEVIIAFDSSQLQEDAVRLAISSGMGAMDSAQVRFLPVPNGTYCELKNAGAVAAEGDIVIFLDSDVIPEPGWLEALLDAFRNPEISVVVGNTYVDLSKNDLYAKAMAIAWMFPLRDSEGGLSPLKMFYANNVAFRRKEFLQHLFPPVPGFIHAPEALLVERLQHEGVTLWSLGDARASHPPPRGLRHFVNRAISGGKARALAAEPSSPGRLKRLGSYVRQDLKSILHNCKLMFSEGWSVGLRIYELPAAIAIGASYHALFLLGSVLSVLAPRVMEPRFKL